MVLEPDTEWCASGDVGPQGWWIVRSHIGWKEERYIPYKSVKTSPQQMRFKTVKLTAIRNKPKPTISASGGVGLLQSVLLTLLSVSIFMLVFPLNLMFKTANKHYSKEAECIFNTAAVSVSSISSSHSVRVWPLLRPMSNQQERVCLQVFSCSSGLSLSTAFTTLFFHDTEKWVWYWTCRLLSSFHVWYLSPSTSAHFWWSERRHRWHIRCLATSRHALFLALAILFFMILSLRETSLEF